eukprot:SAG31_NODE_13025_length_898_cov_4.939925_1_plen_191_part_00
MRVSVRFGVGHFRMDWSISRTDCSCLLSWFHFIINISTACRPPSRGYHLSTIVNAVQLQAWSSQSCNRICSILNFDDIARSPYLTCNGTHLLRLDHLLTILHFVRTQPLWRLLVLALALASSLFQILLKLLCDGHNVGSLSQHRGCCLPNLHSHVKSHRMMEESTAGTLILVPLVLPPPVLQVLPVLPAL